MIAFICLAVLVGVMAQRITGMGFALVASPFIMLLLGPFGGIMLVNLCAIFSAMLVLSRVWRDVDWRAYRRLVIPAVIGIAPGSWLAVTLPSAVLEFGVGALLFVALIASLLATRAQHVARDPGAAYVAGFVSGVMNTTAGIGGPAMSIYAVLTRWPQKVFAATMQPYFATIALVALCTKLILAPGDWPVLEPWLWVGIALSFVIGLLLGERLSKHVSHHAARVFVIVIAFIGSLLAMANGLVAMLATIP